MTGADRMIECDHDSLLIIKTQVGQVKEILDKMDKTLMGNGKEGLCTVVQRHTDEIADIKESHLKQTVSLRWYIGAGFTIMTIILMTLNYLKI